MAIPVPALGDGTGEPAPAPRYDTMRGPVRKGVIEVRPNLDHHYRDDMVEPRWRVYGETYGYGGGYSGVDRGFDPNNGSLDRQPGSGCDTWRQGCPPAEPWWTR